MYFMANLRIAYSRIDRSSMSTLDGRKLQMYVGVSANSLKRHFTLYFVTDISLTH